MSADRGRSSSQGQPGRRGEASATRYLSAADPVLAELIARVGELPARPAIGAGPNGHYAALVRSIVGQQLSTRAARAIYARLLAHFDGEPPTPEQVLAADPEELRLAAGFSHAKITYLRSLAEHVVDGALELDRLEELSDEQVVAELVAVRGIGAWSAHMFLMFRLQRPDVLPVGDLGIRRAARQLYELAALPKPAELERIAEPWRPHRTLACRFLWASLANELT